MMMKFSNLSLVLAFTLGLTACAKQEDSQANDSAASAVVTEEQISAEQQAAIDAIDQPILDEKNTDISAEISNTPADQVTADALAATSSATSNH